MSSKQLHNMFRIQLLTLLGLVTLMPPAFAVDYWLWTGHGQYNNARWRYCAHVGLCAGTRQRLHHAEW